MKTSAIGSNSFTDKKGYTLHLESSYDIIKKELDKLDANYKNKTIDEVIVELDNARHKVYLKHCRGEDKQLQVSIIYSNKLLKINFLIDYMEHLKKYISTT